MLASVISIGQSGSGIGLFWQSGRIGQVLQSSSGEPNRMLVAIGLNRAAEAVGVKMIESGKPINRAL